MSTPTATNADPASTNADPASGRGSPRRASWWLLLIVPILAVAAVAITKATQDESTTAGKAPNAANGHAITIKNFSFSPTPLAVKAGTVITVTNADSTTHTVMADKGNAFSTGDIGGGSTGQITAPNPGKYAFHCAIHNYMTGVIEVTK